jgi:hypothetical protein
MTDENDRAGGDAKWSMKIASLVVGTLASAGIISDAQRDWAVEIAEEEIRVRLVIGDRPPP